MSKHCRKQKRDEFERNSHADSSRENVNDVSHSEDYADARDELNNSSLYGNHGHDKTTMATESDSTTTNADQNKRNGIPDELNQTRRELKRTEESDLNPSYELDPAYEWKSEYDSETSEPNGNTSYGILAMSVQLPPSTHGFCFLFRKEWE